MIKHLYIGQPISQTIHWFGTDTEELYDKNLNDPQQRLELERNNWLNSTIEYSFNSGGHRGPEFNVDDEGFIVLGCSFTSGVGLHYDQIWPELLAKKLDQVSWNLGAAGMGLDTAYRLAEHYVPRLCPSKVILLAPSWTRLELWVEDNRIRVLNYGAFGDVDPLFNNSYMKHWLANDANAYYRAIKNINSIAYICQCLNADFYCYDVMDDFMSIQPQVGGLARDLQHNGPKCHEVFANRVYEDVVNKKTYRPKFLNIDS